MSRRLMSELDRFDHLIWDFNGTLIDDAHICVRAVNPILKQHGLDEIDLQSYRKFFRFPVADYYHDIGFRLTPEQYAKVSDRFHETYFELLHEARIFEGIEETLRKYHGQKTMSVLSAAWQDDLEKLLSHFSIRDYFKHLYGLQDREARSKVERGRELLKISGHSPEKTVLIGDTLHDLEVGKDLGVDVILLTDGHMSEDRLRKHWHQVFSRSSSSGE